MPNTVKGQPRKVALWNKRPVVVLLEDDGDTTHYHGVMIGPVGMTYATALKKLDEAYDAGVAAGGEAWNYDDVIKKMKEAGFEEVQAAVWYE